ncbi:MAG: substrate-binding domain-containing protein [Phycisphaerales bacterium]|nr:substrate-binding domain-containing protein [Phycisphaerales bacterium]
MKLQLALVALALGLASCGEKPEPTMTGGTGDDQKVTYQFGVIAKSQSNQVFQAARTGAQDAARDLSEKYPNVEVEVKWQTPTDEDAQRQAQFIESLTSQGIDGITVSVSNAEILTGAINEAVRNGVEVVCFDSDAPDSDRFAYYGIDDVAAGRKVMEELAAAMGGEGVVAILAGNQNAPNLQKRVQGVIEKAKDYPNITIKETYYHQETPDQAAAKVQQVQNANPDITGWAMVGGWPLFTTNALDGVYEQAKVVSVDHLPAQLDYVRDGQVQALIGQDCYGWGYQTVVMLFEKVHEGKTPANVINTFELSVVNKDNVEDFEGTWEQWLRGD